MSVMIPFWVQSVVGVALIGLVVAYAVIGGAIVMRVCRYYKTPRAANCNVKPMPVDPSHPALNRHRKSGHRS